MPKPSLGVRQQSAASFISSVSNEADDEQSVSSASAYLNYHHDFDMNGHARTAQYEGDDPRPTSKKELWGWYTYAWAAEVFVVCGVGSFIPITLESLARERGVLAKHPDIPCISPQGVSIIASAAPHSKGQQCIVPLPGGINLNTASFAMYTFSFSVLIQALTIITMSGAADHGRYRKTLLIAFATVGSLATMSFLPVHSGVFWIGAVLAIISNTCIGASFVLLNSFLPLLVRHHPVVLAANAASDREAAEPRDPAYDGASYEDDDDLDGERTSISSSAALLPSANKPDGTNPSISSPSTAASPELHMSTRISSTGMSIGYVSSILVQVLSVAILYNLGQSTFSLRLVLFLVGLWWLTFTIPCIFWLRPRPGPPLHLPSTTTSRARILAAYLANAWRSLFLTIRRARRLRDVILFLTAWFLLSDAIATVSGTAILFAKTTLNMPPAALALINVVVMFSGVIGALGWTRLSRFFNLKPVHTILVCLAVFECIPLYALLGYIPAVQRLGYLGLQQQWEVYPLALCYGLVLGGLSSYCRALYGELIPLGFEATFYSLYAVTDKGSSVFGPLVVGAITDARGDIRPAFVFLAVLVAAPAPVMWCVDVERGRREARAVHLDDGIGGADGNEDVTDE